MGHRHHLGHSARLGRGPAGRLRPAGTGAGVRPPAAIHRSGGRHRPALHPPAGYRPGANPAAERSRAPCRGPRGRLHRRRSLLAGLHTVVRVRPAAARPARGRGRVGAVDDGGAGPPAVRRRRGRPGRDRVRHGGAGSGRPGETTCLWPCRPAAGWSGQPRPNRPAAPPGTPPGCARKPPSGPPSRPPSHSLWPTRCRTRRWAWRPGCRANSTPGTMAG